MRVFVHMYNMYEFLEKIHTYVHSYMHACMCTYMQAAFAGSLWTLKQMLAVKWLPASDLLAWPQNCNPTRLGVWGLGFRVRGFCVRCYEGQWSMLCATSSSGRRVPTLRVSVHLQGYRASCLRLTGRVVKDANASSRAARVVRDAVVSSASKLQVGQTRDENTCSWNSPAKASEDWDLLDAKSTCIFWACPP